MFTLSGFGTLGMTHSSLDSADFTSTAFEPSGSGHSRAYDFADDTKLGVQLVGRFTDKLSAVVQVVSQQRYDNTFTPQLEWANLKYAFTPDFSVRIGRIELPTFLNSDYRNVGYANPWVRVPAEVYNTVPITNSDGADLSYRFRLGEVANTVRILYGYSAFHVNPGMIKTTGTGIVGAFDTIEYRDFTAHFGYLHADVKLAVLDPKLPANVYSMAVGYDSGPWFVQAELARVTVDQLTPGYVSGYVTGGYRINKFTPFLTYSESHTLGHATVVPNYNMGQKDISAGVRWDFMKNMDLKVHLITCGCPRIRQARSRTSNRISSSAAAQTCSAPFSTSSFDRSLRGHCQQTRQGGSFRFGARVGRPGVDGRAGCGHIRVKPACRTQQRPGGGHFPRPHGLFSRRWRCRTARLGRRRREPRRVLQEGDRQVGAATESVLVEADLHRAGPASA